MTLRLVRLRTTLARANAIPELASSFSRIHQLRRLETIKLTFVPVSTGLDSGCKGPALQASILGALSESFSIHAPSKLKTLSLQNLRPSDLTPLETPPCQTVLRNLRHLRLSVLYDRTVDITARSDRWAHFWGTLCHRLVLAPTQHALTELSLESNIFVGASSRLSFADLHFPYLCALSLRRIVFEPSVGAESFILRHSATLSRLELIKCGLIIDTISNSTHWEQIWDNFLVGLTTLVALHVHESRGTSWGNRYVRRGAPVTAYWAMFVPKQLDVADDAAFQRFYVTVAARSEKQNTSSRTERGA